MTPSSPANTQHTARLALRTDQQEGIANTVRHLRRPHTRGHVVSACGTGKTLLALRASEELGVRHLAVAVPSLDLVAQWAAAARAERSLARKGRVTPGRAAQLDALDPDWRLPHGADWHRKYHALRRHLEAGPHPATLTRDTVIGETKAGSWLHRQLATFDRLEPGQRDLLTHIGLTPGQIDLDHPHRTAGRRSFAQTVQILALFLQRWQRTPGAREWIEVDGERVMIGPWLAKTRTKLNAGQLPARQQQLLSQVLAEHGLETAAAPVPVDWTEDG